jgi:hypothetical protein
LPIGHPWELSTPTSVPRVKSSANLSRRSSNPMPNIREGLRKRRGDGTLTDVRRQPNTLSLPLFTEDPENTPQLNATDRPDGGALFGYRGNE